VDDVVVITVPTSVTLTWNPVAAPDGDAVQYNVQWTTSPTFTFPAPQSSGWTSGTSWTPSFTSAATWYWRVQARDAVHTDAISPWSTSDSFVIALNAPPAPTLIDEPDVVSAVPVSVTLEWSSVTCPDGHTANYYVEVDDASDFSSPNYNSGAIWLTVTNWSVTVDTNKTWYWRVKARDSYFLHTSNVSPWSTADSFGVLPHNPPAAPALQPEPDIVTAVPTDVTLQWWAVTSPDGDPVEYYVEVDDLPDFSSPNYTADWFSGDCVSNVCKWTITLPPGYWGWRVKARDNAHPVSIVSSWSTIDYFNTLQLPAVPVLIDETNIVSVVPVPITLEWNEVTSPDGDPVEYSVEVNDTSFWFSNPKHASGWITGDCVSGICSWEVTVDPAIAKTWYWKVQVRDSIHTQAVSSFSTVDSFVLMSSNPPPSPTLIDEADIATPAPVSVTLEWNQVTDPDGDPVQYSVQVSQYANFLVANYSSGWISGNCASGICSWTATITAANTWYWRVQARDQTHTEAVSAWSTPADSFATLYGPPPAPILIDEPNVVSADPVTLQWNAVTCTDGDPVDYQVQLDDSTSLFTSVDHDSGWITGDCVSGVCSWTVSVATDKTWYWRVRARDAVHTTSESSWSTVDSFILTSPPIIDESFEGSGYEEFTNGIVSSGCTLNPDAGIPGTPPSGSGSQCLQSVSAPSGYQAYATRVYGSEQPKTFTSFYLYVEAEDLNDGNNKVIGALQDGSATPNSVFILRLNQNAGQLRFNLQGYNAGSLTNYFANITTGAWYKIDIKYDDTTNAWQWRVNGTNQPSGTLSGTHYTGIKTWNFGFATTGQAYAGTIYYDLIKVSTVSYP
jgi:hypothetical protein